jgi:hypothetical protein
MDLVQFGGPSRLPTSTSRRPWTSEEDTALCAAVKKYGSDTGQGSSWAKISSAVGGGRTNKVCNSLFGIGLRYRIVGKDGFILSTHHFEKVDGQGKRMIHYA